MITFFLELPWCPHTKGLSWIITSSAFLSLSVKRGHFSHIIFLSYAHITVMMNCPWYHKEKKRPSVGRFAKEFWCQNISMLRRPGALTKKDVSFRNRKKKKIYSALLWGEMSLFLSCPKSSVTRRNERLIKKSYGNIRPPLPTYSPNDKKNERTRRKARSRETGRRNLCGIMVGAINDVTSCCHALKLISPEEKKMSWNKIPFFLSDWQEKVNLKCTFGH